MKERLSSAALLLAGVLCDALAVEIFILPYDFPVSGITGLARILSHFVALPVSLAVAVFSGVMLLLGLLFVGWRFALSTLLASMAYPAFLAILEQLDLSGLLVESRLLAAVFGGLLTGIAMGLCIRSGGSTGGTDLIGVILNRKLKVPVAAATYVIDFSVLAGQMVFGQFEDILYGIFLLILCTLTMNRIITWGASNVQMFVISDRFAEINAAIQRESDIGSTLLHGRTGRFGQEEDVILCTVRPGRVKAVRDLICAVDPAAFITMTSVTQVYGRGFSLERVMRSADGGESGPVIGDGI